MAGTPRPRDGASSSRSASARPPVAEDARTDASEDNTGGGVLEELQGMLSLSYRERLYGFGACVAVGALFAVLAYVSASLLRARPCVVFLSVSTLFLLGSTCFLLGPVAQLKRMFHPSRLLAMLALLVSLGLAIYSGYRNKPFPCIVFGVCELLAFVWYALSYIPYARSLILSYFGM